MPELSKKMLSQQSSFIADDYRTITDMSDDDYEAVLINLKIVQNEKRAKEAKEYAQAVRFINKKAPDLPDGMKTRRLVIKHPKTEEPLAEVVQFEANVSASKATEKRTKTSNVISKPSAVTATTSE